MYVSVYACYLQTTLSEILNVSQWQKDSAKYLFQNKRLRLSNTQPNNRLKFWILKRKQAESSVWIVQPHFWANTWLSYVSIQSNTALFLSHVYFSYSSSIYSDLVHFPAPASICFLGKFLPFFPKKRPWKSFLYFFQKNSPYFLTSASKFFPE